MRIGLSIAHAADYGYRSGWENRGLSYSGPSEYDVSRLVCAWARQELEDQGHVVTLAEKTMEGRSYQQAQRIQHAELVDARPDLLIEHHINRGAAGVSGCLVLASDHAPAAVMGEAWLDAYTRRQRVVPAGAVFCGGSVERYFGHKAFLQLRIPAVILEVGYITSAVDAAYLTQPAAIEAIALSTVDAVNLAC